MRHLTLVLCLLSMPMVTQAQSSPSGSSKVSTIAMIDQLLSSGQGNSASQARLANNAINSTRDDAPTTAGAAGGVGTAGLSIGTVAAVGLPLLASAAAASGTPTNPDTVAPPANPSVTQSLLQQQLQESANTVFNDSQKLAYQYVTAGLVTPVASWPTALVATYNGIVGGTLNNGASVTGTIQATVDFSRINSQSPTIPGSMTFDGGKGGTTFTLTQIGGYVGGGMSGTYNGQAVTGFIMNGVFYGPSAEQLAGSWSMQNTGASVTASGAFQTKR